MADGCADILHLFTRLNRLSFVATSVTGVWSGWAYRYSAKNLQGTGISRLAFESSFRPIFCLFVSFFLQQPKIIGCCSDETPLTPRKLGNGSVDKRCDRHHCRKLFFDIDVRAVQFGSGSWRGKLGNDATSQFPITGSTAKCTGNSYHQSILRAPRDHQSLMQCSWS